MCRERAGCRPAQIRPLPEAHGEVGFDEIFGVAFNLPTALNKRRETDRRQCQVDDVNAIIAVHAHRDRAQTTLKVAFLLCCSA